MTLLLAVLVAAMFCTGITLIVSSEVSRRPRIVVCPHDDDSRHGRGAKDAEVASVFPSPRVRTAVVPARRCGSVHEGTDRLCGRCGPSCWSGSPLSLAPARRSLRRAHADRSAQHACAYSGDVGGGREPPCVVTHRGPRQGPAAICRAQRWLKRGDDYPVASWTISAATSLGKGTGPIAMFIWITGRARDRAPRRQDQARPRYQQ